MTMELYTFGTSNGKRASVMLEEVGADYTVQKVDLLAGEHQTADFLALNPNGQIPVLVDPDGPDGRIVLDQSVAIMLYLAEKAGKFIPESPAERAAFWPALMSAAGDVGTTVGTVFAITRMAEPHQPTLQAFETRLAGYLGVWDQTFGERTYAAGDEVTVADFALYVVFARLRDVMPALAGGFENVDRWAGVIAARPAVQRGMAVPE